MGGSPRAIRTRGRIFAPEVPLYDRHHGTAVLAGGPTMLNRS